MKYEMCSENLADELDKKQLAIDKLQWTIQKLITKEVLEFSYDVEDLTCVCDSCLNRYERMDEYKEMLKQRALDEAERLKDEGYDH